MKPINPYLAFGLSLIMAIGAAVGTYSARTAAEENRISQLERRVELAEDVLRKDTATRRDLDSLKQSVDQMYAQQQKLIDFEMKYHHAGVR